MQHQPHNQLFENSFFKHSTAQRGVLITLKRKFGVGVLLIVCCIFMMTGVFAQRTSVASGSWSATSTWSGGTVPQEGDSVIINTGHTVTLTAAVTQTAGLRVVGTLAMAGFSFSCGSLSGTGTVNSSAAATFTTGTNNASTTFSGIIGSGAVSLAKQGSGTLLLSGANSYTGSTQLVAGTIELTTSERLPNSSLLVLAGGQLLLNNTGAVTETVGVLQLDENDTIRFNEQNPYSGYRINFSASNASIWSSGKQLIIEGWVGVPNGVASDWTRLFVGSSGSSLTASQLAQIRFSIGGKLSEALLLSTGELVPNQAPAIWNGSVSQAWSNPSNWTPAAVPVPTDSIIIPASAPNMPIILDSVVLRNRLMVLAGASLEVGNTGRLRLSAQPIENTSSATALSAAVRNSGSVVIQFGGEMTMNTYASFQNTGSFNIYGRVSQYYGSLFTGSGLYYFRSQSVYELHNISNGVSIPTATWDSTSTLHLRAPMGTGGISGMNLASWGQSFGSIIIEPTWSSSPRVDFDGHLLEVKGDFKILTNGMWVHLTRRRYIFNVFGGITGEPDCGPTNTLIIRGDLQINPQALLVLGGVYGGSPIPRYERYVNLVVGGNLYNYGTLMTQYDMNTIQCTRPTVTLTGANKVIAQAQTSSYIGGSAYNSTNRVNMYIDGSYTLQSALRLIYINLYINGSLSLDTFQVTGNPASFTSNAGSSLYISHPQGLVLGTAAAGSIQVTGGRTFSPYTRFIYNGTQAQVTGNAIAGISNLTIDNPAGVRFSGEQDVAVWDTLRLLRGVLTATSGRKLILGTAGNAGAVIQTNGWAAGQFRRYVPNGSVSNLLFPVGDSLNPAGARISFTGNTTGSGYLDITSYDSVPPRASGIGPSRHIRQMWKIANGGVGGFSSWSAELNFSNADIVGSFRSQHRILRNTGGSWFDVTKGATTSNSTTASSLTSLQFGDFYIGEGKVWNGSVDTDWEKSANWTPVGVPDSDIDITIPSSTQAPNQPILNRAFDHSAVLTIISGGTLTIQSAGTFTNTNEISNSGSLVNTGSLRVGQLFTNTGTISSSTGRIEFFGTSNQTIPAALTAVKTLSISGAGTKTLSANLTSITDSLIVQSGNVLAMGSYAIGATTAPSVLWLQNGGIAGSQITGVGALHVGVKITSTYFGSGNASAIIYPPVTLTANTTIEIANDGSTAADLTLTNTLNGTTQSVTKTGLGTLLLQQSLGYTGNTNIAGGEIRLNPAANTTPASSIILNGTRLSTSGITATRTIANSSTLQVLGADTLSLEAATAHTISFANSSAETWSGTRLLITGWSGGYNGAAGTGGQVFIGNSASGLTPSQLSLVRFTDGSYFYLATQLSTGELVPLSNSLAVGVCPTTTAAGGSFTLPFTYTAAESFTATTGFTAQLSDASGSFANPVSIGTAVGNASGAQTMTVTIPTNTSLGTGYRIRMVSIDPSITSADNGVNIEVLGPVTIQTQPTATSVCLNGSSPTLTVSATGNGTLTYQWYENTTNSNTGGTLLSGAQQNTYNAPVSTVGTVYYYVHITDTYASTTSVAVAVSVESTNTWLGTVSITWTDPANWSACGVPSATSTVVMGQGAAYYPIISSGTAQVGSLSLPAGTSITVNGTGVFQLSGTVSSSGGQLLVASGTLQLQGTTAQNIPSGVINGASINKLIVNNAAGVSFQETLTVGSVEWIVGQVQMTSGQLVVSGTGGGSVSGYGSSGYVVGPLKRTVSGSGDFPVGSTTAYLKAALSGLPGTNNEYAISWIAGDPTSPLDPTNTGAAGGAHPVTSFGAGVVKVSTMGQWDWQDFNNAAAGATITVTLPNLSTFSQPAALRLVGWDGTQWVNLSGNTGASGNTAGSTLGGTMISGISALGIATNAVWVNAKVFLQGAYSTSTGLMTTSLRNLGLIPLTQPYTSSPWSYSGEEAVTSIPASVTDWVLVELRSASTPATVIARRAAFVLNNGNVVDLDGTSPVQFTGQAEGTYHVVIRHRNHLSIRTASAVSLSPYSTLLDFTLSQSAAYQNPSITGNTAMQVMSNGVFVMCGGNANSNSNIRYVGPSNDNNQIINIALGGVVSNILQNVYRTEDINLNGNVRYAGPQNDNNLLINIILGGVVSRIIIEHL